MPLTAQLKILHKFVRSPDHQEPKDLEINNSKKNKYHLTCSVHDVDPLIFVQNPPAHHGSRKICLFLLFFSE